MSGEEEEIETAEPAAQWASACPADDMPEEAFTEPAAQGISFSLADDMPEKVFLGVVAREVNDWVNYSISHPPFK